MCDPLQIGVHFFGASVVVKRWLSRPQLILVVRVQMMWVLPSYALPRVSRAIVEEVLFVRTSPKNCPRVVHYLFIMAHKTIIWLNHTIIVIVTMIDWFNPTETRVGFFIGNWRFLF